jgi:hypothetical protein
MEIPIVVASFLHLLCAGNNGRSHRESEYEREIKKWVHKNAVCVCGYGVKQRSGAALRGKKAYI